MDLSAPEIIAAVSILAITSLIATNNAISLPPVLTSPVVGVFLVVIGLGLFSHSPIIGISILLLVAVLFFRSNIAAAARSPISQYADATVPDQSMGAATEYSSTKSDPRSYAQFQETDPMNRMFGTVEGFAPAPVAEGEAVDGQYPKDSPRYKAPTVSSEFVYRPEPDTGSNEFQRYGPNLDEKTQSIAYYS